MSNVEQLLRHAAMSGNVTQGPLAFGESPLRRSRLRLHPHHLCDPFSIQLGQRGVPVGFLRSLLCAAFRGLGMDTTNAGLIATLVVLTVSYHTLLGKLELLPHRPWTLGGAAKFAAGAAAETARYDVTAIDGASCALRGASSHAGHTLAGPQVSTSTRSRTQRYLTRRFLSRSAPQLAPRLPVSGLLLRTTPCHHLSSSCSSPQQSARCNSLRRADSTGVCSAL